MSGNGQMKVKITFPKANLFKTLKQQQQQQQQQQQKF